MKNTHLLAAALGAASLALIPAVAPVLAHEAQDMRSPYPPCGHEYERHMEQDMHHHGMMDEGHGMEPGRGYGGMSGWPMMAPDQDRGGMGPGMMMAPGMMMGPDAMMGPGSRGMGGERGWPLRSDLTTDDVRHMMEHQLEWMGNPNLKLGKVEESGEDEIIAEIVTQDGSLVQRLEIDKHTGWTQPAR